MTLCVLPSTLIEILIDTHFLTHAQEVIQSCVHSNSSGIKLINK